MKDAQGGVIPGRDRRAHQRDARDQVRAGRHQRDGQLRLSEHHGRTPTRSRLRCRPSRRCDGRASSSAAVSASASSRSRWSRARISRNRDGDRRITARADAERASARTRSRATQIDNLPVARNNFTSLTAFTPGVVQARRVGGRHPSRRRRPEQHHDGRHLGDGHRQQRPDAEHERRRDR